MVIGAPSRLAADELGSQIHAVAYAHERDVRGRNLGNRPAIDDLQRDEEGGDHGEEQHLDAGHVYLGETRAVGD